MTNTPSSSNDMMLSNNLNEEVDEDDDDPDIPESENNDVEDILANFREKWQKELRITPKNRFINNTNSAGNLDDGNLNKHSIKEDDLEETAKMWYMKGSEMERAGKLYEAIQFYKRAVQLVPDIEFKIREKHKNKQVQYEEDVEEDSNVDDFHFDNKHLINEDVSDDDNETIIKEGALLLGIQRKMNKIPFFCIPEYEQRSTHISCLPIEIILYILRWVVSSELDLRSLELCSQVSRGFYLCARDPEIWKLSCTRAWGMGESGSLPNIYSSWREMFLLKSRLHFNGCYISKTTYIRHGENSFQDQFYRPWHLVVYYRYLRFFPDGVVLMLTTPDEPAQCVSLLRTRTVVAGGNRSLPILSGHYRLKDDKVTIAVQQENAVKSVYKRGRRKNDNLFESSEQSFHLELQIQSYSKRKHIELVWTQYSVFTRSKTGVEYKSSFDLANNRFPSLWFSRVKSYTQESSNPLQ